MNDLPDEIARINALTTNARNTWLVMLGVLVFVGITLMGVEHIDFYGVDRATKLPLVNVEVPTRYFFIAAPILTAAIYGYFHLYLIRLWDVLSEAAARQNGRRLGDNIAPWLVTDAALHYRAKRRRDYCATPRTMETPAMVLNITLAWVFGLLVLLFMWSISTLARDFTISLIAAFSLLTALGVGIASFISFYYRLRAADRRTLDMGKSNIFKSLLVTTTFLALLSTILNTTNVNTFKLFKGWAVPQLSLADEAIVERPVGWLPYNIAYREFRANWCNREKMRNCDDFDIREEAFEIEWQTRRSSALSDLRRPEWDKRVRKKPNFSNADLRNIFLSSANLRKANMQGANLRRAKLESTNLNSALMQKAVLFRAQLQGASLRKTLLMHANLGEAQMERANLRGAQLEGTKLAKSNLAKAKLGFSHITGSQDEPVSMTLTNFNAATNHGGALRHVELSGAVYDKQTDFRNAFLDDTVIREERFENQMQNPCQWIEDTLTDENFYSFWRWWIELNPERGSDNNWSAIGPKKWLEVPLPTDEQLAKYNLTDCKWKTGPIPKVSD